MSEYYRGKSLAELEDLALDLRQIIIATCLKNGGHIGASLGAVELAVALHTVFDSPAEPIVWDVGHQAYAHKLLTGRRDEFATLRKKGGLSGFLSRAESEHDAFGAGHSSTALSAALGMAWARHRADPDSKLWTVAVVGDGALSAGLAFEALNNLKAAGHGRLLVLLNDNHMSISENVGQLAHVFSEGRARDFFELMGLEYAGPVDGHDLGSLIGLLQSVRSAPHDRPVVVHALTQKGRGYAPAEERPAAYHGVSTGGAPQRTYSDAFGEAMCKLAQADPRIVAITAAMAEGTGLEEFSRRFSDRFFDVGIAEPHAVTFAAGLATQGLRPVVAVYSTFLQRGIDQMIHDVCLQGLPVIFAVDRAGLVGADGPTHHGVFDLAYAGMIPGLTVVAPTCLEEVETELAHALGRAGPTLIRYPRGSGTPAFAAPQENGLRRHAFPDRPEFAIVALGASAAKGEALAAKFRAPVALLSTSMFKPLSPALLAILKTHADLNLLTLEDGVMRGGFGKSLMEQLGPRKGGVWCVGIEDLFVGHGSTTELEDELGISAGKLAVRLRDYL